MENISVNRIKLAYQRSGIGTPLVLIHGFPLDSSTWEDLTGHLAPGFDVIRPDLRGFGSSTSVSDDTSVEEMASDLAGLLDELKLPQVVIAGHSMGGYVALAFAHAYPHKVLGLALISSQAAPDPDERKAARYASAEQVAAEGPQAVVGMAEKLTADPQKFAPVLRETILRQPAQGLIGGLKAMARRPDATGYLATVDYPVLLVHGLADALIPPDRSREIKKLHPQAELVEMKGVGHSAMLEAPVETAAAFMKFLKK